MICGDCKLWQRQVIRSLPARLAKTRQDGTVVREASLGEVLGNPHVCTKSGEFKARTAKACTKPVRRKEDAKTTKKAGKKAAGGNRRRKKKGGKREQRPGGA